ncbi:MAG: VIT1/CCC1 family protein [Bacteroidales bacterium]
MEKKNLSEKEMKLLLGFQQDECNATEIYKRLGNMAKSDHNRDVLLSMSHEESGHYEFISNYTGKKLHFSKSKVFMTTFLARVFGLTFVLKRLEKDESLASSAYEDNDVLKSFAATEDKHEDALLDMIDERFLKYMGSIVLGLNDALVEFTGALAGYTLALGSCSMVALTGSITGIAAALSMGSSEYLSTVSDGGDRKHAFQAAIYTSAAYLVTVFLLILPYIVIPYRLLAAGTMLALAIIIIAVFNYYYSIVRNEKFTRRFGEMATISLSVAVVSFFIGFLLKMFTGIEA